MAIDSRRKRASIASLGLAFLGASIVPDGSFIQADRQAIANSYYGITSGAGSVEIGGVAQLQAIASSGGITIELAIGGSSQIGAYGSSGALTIEQLIGGSSQLGVFDSSGGITVVGEYATAPSKRTITVEGTRIVDASRKSRTITIA